MENQPFRVIVIGGGPVGLTAAHALLAANIDFIVLEARDTFTPEEGASLLAYGSTRRVWHQLGLHDAMAARACPIDTRSSADHSGSVYLRGSPDATQRRLFGAAPWNFHRKELMDVLYSELPAEVREQRLHGGRKVCGLDIDDEGVTVRCEDGSVERGSMVLGVDGVYSKTRSLMRDLIVASRAKEGSDDSEGSSAPPPERPYRAEYRCLWGTCPAPEACAPSSNAESHGPERSIMFMTGRDGRSWFFLYERLHEARDESQRYTAEDQEDMAARFSRIHLLPGLPFGDIWPTHTACGMADQLEGVLPQDNWRLFTAQGGRVVLAGDAVHRMTPNLGWGFNSGVNDVCALVSLLRAEVATGPSLPPSPTTAQLDSIFARYAEARCVDDGVAGVVGISGMVTRRCAWPRGRGLIAAAVAWLLTRVVPLLVPDFEAKMVRKLLGGVMRRGRVLEFLKEDEDTSARVDEKLFVREVGWDFPLPTVADTMVERDHSNVKQKEKVAVLSVDEAGS